MYITPYHISAGINFRWKQIASHFHFIDGPSIFDVLAQDYSDILLPLKLDLICYILKGRDLLIYDLI
jgi:hypothetical protein